MLMIPMAVKNINLYYHSADSMGAMGAIAPTLQNVWGNAIIFAPQFFGVWERSNFLFILC